MKKLFIIMFMLFSLPAMAGGFGGTAVIDATVDVDNDSQNLSTDLTYVAGWYDGKSFEGYGIWNKDLNTVEFEEANIKFSLFDLNWSVGKKAAPIGFMHLQRPEQSMFITAPRADFISDGLYLNASEGPISVDGMYLEDSDEYVVKTTIDLFNDGFVGFVSYNNVLELENTYGQFVLGGLFKYESLLVNLSVTGEYMPDTGNFWARSVTGPGVFDKIGLFAGYYNIEDNSGVVNGYNEFSYSPDAWTYGGYIDLSDNVTASVEYKLDEGLNPIIAQFVATF